jgi:hypothetical protein
MTTQETVSCYRVQPAGLSLEGHVSGLASEKVQGIFAFEGDGTDLSALLDTYTAIHVAREVRAGKAYEIVTFLAAVVARPADSEGIVVTPLCEMRRASW